MLLIVDIPIDEYDHIVYEDDGIDELREIIAKKYNINVDTLKNYNSDLLL